MSAEPVTRTSNSPMFSDAGALLKDLLPRDHRRLDAMLASILELIHVHLRPALDEHWTVFEDAVLAHLDAEEMFIVPELARHNAPRASEIRAEHAMIRCMLAEIGIGLELHLVREDRMKALAGFLRQHAAAEEVDFYPWADTVLAEGTLRRLVRRLRLAWERSWTLGSSAPAREGAAPPVRKRPRNAGA